jgi:large subunit ribosomal protein L25
MEKLVLKSEVRTQEENVRDLRASKTIPAVVYGHKQESISIKLNNSELLRAYRVAGENHVLSLEVNGKKIDVLIHDAQFHPVTGDFLHVDFLALTAGEKVHTHIPLVFVGVSPAKIEEGAVIEELIKSIEVKCLPKDLVDSIEVDLSKLQKTGDNIKVSDLTIPAKLELVHHTDDVIAVAAKARVEKVAETVETPTEETK